MTYECEHVSHNWSCQLCAFLLSTVQPAFLTGTRRRTERRGGQIADRRTRRVRLRVCLIERRRLRIAEGWVRRFYWAREDEKANFNRWSLSISRYALLTVSPLFISSVCACPPWGRLLQSVIASASHLTVFVRKIWGTNYIKRFYFSAILHN